MGLVETAGGVRSPLAADGDCLDYCAALDPDVVVLVADAGLGTINAVRLTLDALDALRGLAGTSTVVVLNRFDERSDLHRRNLECLRRPGRTTRPHGSRRRCRARSTSSAADLFRLTRFRPILCPCCDTASG